MSLTSSHDKLTIALDAMGGDNAPACVIEGADIISKKYPEVSFLIYGDQEIILPALDNYPKLKNISTLIHTDEAISDSDKPSQALRRGRNSSMGLAVKAVKAGEAHAMVSAGNTGALMAMSKVMLRTLPGIDRPAIGGLIPTMNGLCVVLDLGANAHCDASNLFEFAVMGSAFACSTLKLEKPSIGLLNIGSEEMKGNEVVKAAAVMLRESESSLNFYGYIEGNDVCGGAVDVVVTDGFTGNVALKMAEGTAGMITSFLKEELKASIAGRIGGMIAKPALKSLLDRVDPRMHNGAMFLGLNGIVVKSHGSMDALGTSHSIGVAIGLAEFKINERIIEEMVKSGHILPEEDGLDYSSNDGEEE